jgi:hypothetical protein
MVEMKIKTKIAREPRSLNPQRWGYSDYNQEHKPKIMEKNVKDFEPAKKVLPEWEADQELPEDVRIQKIYELMEESANALRERGEGRRKLVTLNEANEVTRRITAGKEKEVRAFAQQDKKEGEEGREEKWDEIVDC